MCKGMSTSHTGSHVGACGPEARGQLGLCTQDMATGPCREVQGRGQMSRACHCRCCHHADPQDGIPLDSAPGRRLLGSEGSETPSAPVPHQHRPAQGQLRRSAGTWFLVAVASSCRSLQEQGHRAEATTLHVTPQGAAMAVSTFRKLPRRPRGGGRGRRGDGLPRLRHPVPGAGAAAVGEAVRYVPAGPGLHTRRAVWWARMGTWALPSLSPALAFRPRGGDREETGGVGAGVRSQTLAHSPAPRAPCPPSPHPPSGRPGAPCVPHAARSLPVSESFLSVFEQRVQGANLTEDHTLFFPKYGFCEAADQFHVLDEVRR
ncbi:complement component C8 gamma chain isoform X4 [Physeter macrocephalus]|uniref:Complement component C8 gamma chain isoform X4 n=1 Tax=Physeter macrocephalus TaxID=9755 RepID=A0A9W2WK33_PHYMC|nr:complement component C8 gamma chain isoform X4 [Physeter catodon]